MAVNLYLEAPYGRLTELQNILGPKNGEKVLAKALTIALSGAKFAAEGKIHERYGIPVSEIARHLRVEKATTNLKSSRYMAARLVIKSHRLPISRFLLRPPYPPSQKGIPVSARTKISAEIVRGQVRVWSHAFLANMGNNAAEIGGDHEGLFSRKGKARLPIQEHRSISIPEMLGYAPIINGVIDVAKERLDQVIDQQVRLMLEGGYK